MNNQALYEEILLDSLYKIGSMSTLDIESTFNYVDAQLANNVISNRGNSTSPIKKGFIDYDEQNQIISITQAGRQEVERRFPGRRN